MTERRYRRISLDTLLWTLGGFAEDPALRSPYWYSERDKQILLDLLAKRPRPYGSIVDAARKLGRSKGSIHQHLYKLTHRQYRGGRVWPQQHG